MISVARKIKNSIHNKVFRQNLPVVEQELNLKLIDKNAIKIIKTLNSKGFDAYLVGGCVRDILLGLKPKDFDISTNATPKQIHKIFKRSRIIGRRFQIVHILFGKRDFIEVATFRGEENNTKMLKRDNNFGDIFSDSLRRDLTINSLYYDIQNKQIIDINNSITDIENKNITVIGDANLRFNQDPVRILRVIRFSVKLGFSIDKDLEQIMLKHKHLLKNIPAARFYEESIKLFHNSKSYQTFQALIQFDCLKYLFPNTKDNQLIQLALNNTANRIKNNQRVSPAFIFAVFLYDDYLQEFRKLSKKIKHKSLAETESAKNTIFKQKKSVSTPKFVDSKIINTWLLQYKLGQKNPKTMSKILQHKDFRMAFDFLEMRSKTSNGELKSAVQFWEENQKCQHKKISNTHASNKR